jgi:hypothetical protein
MMNDQKQAAATTMKALIPLGALSALVAGCGGGGGGMTAALPHQQPSGSAPATSNTARTTAMLTITIPARGARSSARKRAPKYISQGSAALGVSVGTTGQPAPAQTFFALPTPGPSPMSTTLPVGAPVGNDTVSVNIYDGMPSASASPNLLSTGSTTATISTGSTVAVQALGVAAGVAITGPSPNPASVEFFENNGAAQSVALTATAIDADGYAITGTLASPVPIQAPAGVSVAPASLTTSGATLTATYAALQSATGGAISGGLPLDTANGSTDDYDVLATQYLFIASNSGSSNALYVVDPIARTVVGTFPLPTYGAYDGSTVVGVAGCATGETVLVSQEGFTDGVTLPPPGSSTSSVAAVSLTGRIAPRSTFVSGSANDYLAADSACGVYSALDATPTRYSGFGSTVTATPITTSGAVTWAPNDAIAVAGSTIYATNVDSSTSTYTVQSVPVAGGNVTNVGTVPALGSSDFGLCVGGSTVYELNSSCSSSPPSFGYALTTIPGLVSTSLGTTTLGTTPTGAPRGYAVAPNGTVYLFIPTPSAFSAASSSVPVVDVATTAGAVMSDGRYLATLSTSTTVPSVQIESTSATVGGSPTPVGSPIPLVGTSASSSFAMAFPH